MPTLHISSRRAVQIADYPIGATYGPRTMHDFELVWLITGSARRTVSPRFGPRHAQEHELSPDMVTLARPGDDDFYRWDPRVPSRHAHVHFSVTNLGDLPDPADWPRIRSFSEFPLLEALCDYLLDLSRNESARSRTRSADVLRWLVELFAVGPAPEDPLSGLPDTVAIALDHAARVWSKGGLRVVPVQELATAAHVSTGHLHRRFQDSLGMGPARCLELVRLWQAATLLQRSNATVGEVGATCGYPDRYHFSRRFRDLYGVSPRQFRLDGSQDPGTPLRVAQMLGLGRRILAPGQSRHI